MPIGVSNSVGVEEDVLTIGRPVENLVVDAAAGRNDTDVVVERELARRSAFDADDVHLAIPGILAREGDPAAVGRELREEFLTRAGRQASGEPSCRLDDPDVAAVHEGDLRGADVGVAQQSGEAGLSLDGLGVDGRTDGREQRQDREENREVSHSGIVS